MRPTFVAQAKWWWAISIHVVRTLPHCGTVERSSIHRVKTAIYISEPGLCVTRSGTWMVGWPICTSAELLLLWDSKGHNLGVTKDASVNCRNFAFSTIHSMQANNYCCITYPGPYSFPSLSIPFPPCSPKWKSVSHNNQYMKARIILSFIAGCQSSCPAVQIFKRQAAHIAADKCWEDINSSWEHPWAIIIPACIIWRNF